MSDIIRCDGCGKSFDFDKIPDENVISRYESRGEFWGAPSREFVVIGCHCPYCGNVIRF